MQASFHFCGFDFLGLQVEKLKKDLAIVGVFKSAKDKEFKAFEAAAGNLWSDFDFAHTFDASLVPEVHAKGAPQYLHFSFEVQACSLHTGN
jgi:hypothetical protein